MEIIKPTPSHLELLESYIAEYPLNVSDTKKYLADINDYVLQVKSGLVPCTTFFALDDNQIVGIVNIRHCFNKNLLEWGGHIGYNVRPSQRRKGYATKMLLFALDFCRSIGIDRALLTCDVKNEASRKTILKANGIYQNAVIANNSLIERYYIDLPTSALSVAYNLAQRLHKDQFDKNNVPYFYHPLIVSANLNSEDERIVGLLHDIIEDTPLTFSDLANYFPSRIVEAVRLLTKIPRQDYQVYLANLKGNPLAKNVKIADLTHNADLRRFSSPSKKDKLRCQHYLNSIEFLKK